MCVIISQDAVRCPIITPHPKPGSKGQIHKRDTQAYLLIRRRIPSVNLALTSWKSWMGSDNWTAHCILGNDDTHFPGALEGDDVRILGGFKGRFRGTA